jgi:hypothetical protein
MRKLLRITPICKMQATIKILSFLARLFITISQSTITVVIDLARNNIIAYILVEHTSFLVIIVTF